MTKGIAIQTILMLLVGILVVGIIVYMVYRYMFAPGLSQEDCRGQIVSWCDSCKAAGCFGTAPLPTACATITYTISTACDTYYGTGKPGTCDGSKNWCANFGIT